jgi:hypothetical protein
MTGDAATQPWSAISAVYIDAAETIKIQGGKVK